METQNNITPGFTSKYRVHRLVYFEELKYVGNADAKEKCIKGWLREKKVMLIRSHNPTWTLAKCGSTAKTCAASSLK